MMPNDWWTLLQAVIWIGSHDEGAVSSYNVHRGNARAASDAGERAIRLRRASKLYDNTPNADPSTQALIPREAALEELYKAILGGCVQAYDINGRTVDEGVLSQSGSDHMLCAPWRLSRTVILKRWPGEPRPARKAACSIPQGRVEQAMVRICQVSVEEVGHPLKRDDAVRKCMEETKCDRPKARAAYSSLPPDLKNRQGRRKAAEEKRH